MQGALFAWFFAMLAIVVVQVMRGRIPLDGMLDAKTDRPGARPMNFDRTQLLIASLGFALLYVVRALHLEQGAPMPDVPSSVLYALAGSQAVYLGGKIARAPRRGRRGRK